MATVHTHEPAAGFRRPRLGRREIVIGGWLVTAVVLTALALNPGGVLAVMPKRTFVWCDLVALAAGVYAAGLCLTHWRNPPTLWLAITFVGFSVFIFDSLGTLTLQPKAAGRLSLALWWVVPLTIAAWVEAALAIARITPLTKAHRWQTLIRAGKIIEGRHLRPFLTAVGVPKDENWTLPGVRDSSPQKRGPGRAEARRSLSITGERVARRAAARSVAQVLGALTIAPAALASV